MPAEAAFEGAEEGLGHPAEIGLFHVAILDIVGDAVGKNVVDADFADAEAVAFEELLAFAARVGVGDRAAGLRLGVFGDEVRGSFQNWPRPSVSRIPATLQERRW